jgi:hypothetical protein
MTEVGDRLGHVNHFLRRYSVPLGLLLIGVATGTVGWALYPIDPIVYAPRPVSVSVYPSEDLTGLDIRLTNAGQDNSYRLTISATIDPDL